MSLVVEFLLKGHLSCFQRQVLKLMRPLQWMMNPTQEAWGPGPPAWAVCNIFHFQSHPWVVKIIFLLIVSLFCKQALFRYLNQNSSQIFNRVYVCGMFSSWSVAFTCCSCQLTLSKFIFTSFYLLLITYLFVRESSPLKFLHLQFSLFCFLWSLNGNV